MVVLNTKAALFSPIFVTMKFLTFVLVISVIAYLGLLSYEFHLFSPKPAGKLVLSWYAEDCRASVFMVRASLIIRLK